MYFCFNFKFNFIHTHRVLIIMHVLHNVCVKIAVHFLRVYQHLSTIINTFLYTKFVQKNYFLCLCLCIQKTCTTLAILAPLISNHRRLCDCGWCVETKLGANEWKPHKTREKYTKSTDITQPNSATDAIKICDEKVHKIWVDYNS